MIPFSNEGPAVLYVWRQRGQLYGKASYKSSVANPNHAAFCSHDLDSTIVHPISRWFFKKSQKMNRAYHTTLVTTSSSSAKVKFEFWSRSLFLKRSNQGWVLLKYGRLPLIFELHERKNPLKCTKLTKYVTIGRICFCI